MRKVNIPKGILVKGKFYKLESESKNVLQGFWSQDYRRAFQTLKDIPFASLTAISAALGFALAWAYARSLGFHAEPSALATHGVLVAVVTFLLFLLLGLYLIFPGLIANLFGMPQVPQLFNLFSQLVALCLVFLAAYYDDYINCGEQMHIFHVGCYAVILFSIAGILEKVLSEPLWMERIKLLGLSVFIGFSGLLTFLIIYVYSTYFFDKSEYSTLTFIVLLVCALLVNTAIAIKSFHKVLAIALFMAILFFAFLPMSLQQGSKTLNLIASASGIRGNSTISIKLTKEACNVVASRVRDILENKLNCNEHYLETVDAQILFGIGSDWLIELPMQEGKTSAYMLTIPSKGIQIEYPTIKKKQTVIKQCV